LLAEHAGVLFGQDLGLLNPHAGRRQPFDEGMGVEMAVAMFPMWLERYR
jgi:hypothetical protein